MARKKWRQRDDAIISFTDCWVCFDSEAPKPVEKKPPAHPAREQKAPREQKESREPRKENGAGGEKKLVEKQAHPHDLVCLCRCAAQSNVTAKGSRNSGEGDTGKFRPPNRRPDSWHNGVPFLRRLLRHRSHVIGVPSRSQDSQPRQSRQTSGGGLISRFRHALLLGER